LHPYFYIDEDSLLEETVIGHIEHLIKYVKEYCNIESKERWCDEQIDTLEKHLH
jgi:hypothetical protein